MKILETVHNKVHYWLVFNGTELLYKAKTYEEAEAFIVHATSNFTA